MTRLERHPYPRSAAITITIDADKELEIPPFEISFDLCLNSKGKMTINTGYIAVIYNTHKKVAVTEPIVENSIYIDKASDGSILGVEVLVPPVSTVTDPEIINTINEYITTSADDILATAMGLITSAWSACRLTIEKLEKAQGKALDLLQQLLDEEEDEDDDDQWQ